MANDDLNNLLWKEWKYRHEVYWKSLFRWGGSIVTISIIPYIKNNIILYLGKDVLIFPVLSGFLSIAGGWHLAAEYARIKEIRKRYEEKIAQPPHNIKCFLSWSIGSFVTVIFIIGFILLSVINGYELYKIASQPDRQYQNVSLTRSFEHDELFPMFSIKNKVIHSRDNTYESTIIINKAKHIRLFYNELLHNGFKSKEAMALIVGQQCICDKVP